MTETRAYVGLGSNLDGPAEQVTRALHALDGVERTRLAARSRLYRSPPLGPTDQPDYVNAVAALDTALDAHALLDALQAVERDHGRVRDGTRWGPRTLDLDILLFGESRIADERLRVPHPEMHRRPFVVHPLLEIAPHLEVPGRGSVAALARRVAAGELVPIAG